ncbi:choice-of-anchor P family protein [Actinosynnema sp. NPDC020468]|uniref:choice-of-anchor P family protein n=1 Tax=Actinosynnema sp. NPDC020468 TaxID=3154488 RepID=UPI0033F75739
MGLRRVAGAAVVLLLAGGIQAHAVDGNLPGGTGIGVVVSGPARDTVVPRGPVRVTGTASVGKGVAVRDTALTYVVDASGSTGGGCTGGPTILDCEIAAARSLNATAAAPDSVVGSVGAVVFGSTAVVADVRPGGGEQSLTTPTADEDGDGVRDVEAAVASIGIGSIGRFTAKSFPSGTDYVPAVTAATSVTAAQTQARRIVLFLSDGFSNTDVRQAVGAVPANVDYFTFAVGTGARCVGGDYTTSLKAVADLTGGTCTEVPDPSTLPSVVPGIIAAQLTGLTLSVDGGAPVGVSSVTPVLPRTGPAAVDYAVDTPPLEPGTHELCVTARGTDGGGPGAVSDCTRVVVNDPPSVAAGGPYAGREGAAVALAGVVTDPDGPPSATRWTATPGAGVDAGATCSFADPTAAATTVTCDDDGTWTVALAANDSLHPDVVASTSLTLTNVAPAVTVSAPANGVLVKRGAAVAVTAPFTDVARHDTHTCTVDFADGSPVVAGAVAQQPGAGTCTASHAYTGVGAHNVLVTVTDDDGGSATAVVSVVSYVDAEAWALSATGLLGVAKTPLATCPPSSDRTVATAGVPAVGSARALHADCALSVTTGRTTANAGITGATLLAGAVSLAGVSVSCTATEDGVSGTSSVGTFNGQTIGDTPRTIGVPGVATVHLNQTVLTPGGVFARYAVRVVTLLGQEIVLGGCRLG